LTPLYLAAAGAKGSDLYAMADVLGAIQRACQDHGAAAWAIRDAYEPSSSLLPVHAAGSRST
jgi:hypothetical protein